MKWNEKGFSLLELIICISIIAILSSGVVMGIRVLRSNDMKKASATVKGTLNNTRTYCLSKQSANCEFYKTTEGLWCKVTVNGEVISDEKIAGAKVTIKYMISDTKAEYQVTDAGVQDVETAPLTIAFDHSSGALKAASDVGGHRTYLYALFVCKDDKAIRYVFTPLTGKIEQR